MKSNFRRWIAWVLRLFLTSLFSSSWWLCVWCNQKQEKKPMLMFALIGFCLYHWELQSSAIKYLFSLTRRKNKFKYLKVILIPGSSLSLIERHERCVSFLLLKLQLIQVQIGKRTRRERKNLHCFLARFNSFAMTSLLSLLKLSCSSDWCRYGVAHWCRDNH